MTQCQDEFRNLSGCVIKILTGGRILQISISWCQIEAEIRSFHMAYLDTSWKFDTQMTHPDRFLNSSWHCIICYIFEKLRVQGCQIWHSHVSIPFNSAPQCKKSSLRHNFRRNSWKLGSQELQFHAHFWWNSKFSFYQVFTTPRGKKRIAENFRNTYQDPKSKNYCTFLSSIFQNFALFPRYGRFVWAIFSLYL